MWLAQRILNIPSVRRSSILRTFVTAAWLGWQIESNWADPLLFLVYSFARPISGVMILVVMYSVVTNGATQESVFAYIYLGNALYILVGSVISGVSWTVINDREQYRTTRQLYTTPMNTYSYMIGRGVARLLIGLISVTITVVFGVLVFHLPITLMTINWPLLIASTMLGIISLSAIGLIFGSLTMMAARHLSTLGDALSAAFYLFCGAIFPLDVLPPVLQSIGFVFPVTYWLELARRALLGTNAGHFQMLSSHSNAELMGILAGLTLVVVVLSLYYHRFSLHRAKENGMFDMDTAS